VQRFRGGLVFKAHRLESNKDEEEVPATISPTRLRAGYVSTSTSRYLYSRGWVILVEAIWQAPVRRQRQTSSSSSLLSLIRNGESEKRHLELVLDERGVDVERAKLVFDDRNLLAVLFVRGSGLFSREFVAVC